MKILWIGILLGQAMGKISVEKCSHKLANCTDNVQPFLNDVHYMFPTTQPDVDGMCKMWSQIMECVRRYMAECSTDDQKTKFNDAVGDSIGTVHAICSSERHRRDYLEHASCFKEVSTEHCGIFYQKMVEHTTNPLAQDSHICCAYGQFEQCVQEPLRRQCGSPAGNMMDHSMAFLGSRCEKMPWKTDQSGNCFVPDPPPRTTAPPTLPPSPATAFRIKVSMTTTTPRPWTPRTVIYPLPETQRSRSAPVRGDAQPSGGAAGIFTLCFLFGAAIKVTILQSL